MKDQGSIGQSFVLHEGEPLRDTIHDTVHVPQLALRPFSLLVAAKTGHSYDGVDDKVGLVLKEGGKIHRSECGYLYCFEAHCLYCKCANVVIAPGVRNFLRDASVETNVFHACFYPHSNEVLVREMVKIT